MTTQPLTLEAVQRLAVEVVRAYEDRAQQAEYEHGGDWLKVLNHWQGWDPGVIVSDPDTFRDEYPYQAEEVPSDCIAVVYSGYAGPINPSFLRASDSPDTVAKAVLSCLPDEQEDE